LVEREATVQRSIAILAVTALILAGTPSVLAASGSGGQLLDRSEDEAGRPLTETRSVPDEPGLRVTKTWVYPGPAPSQPTDDGDGVRFPVVQEPATDCDSDAHDTWGFRWLAPYHAFTNAHVQLLTEAGTTWNLATGGHPFGGVVQGEVGEPTTHDDVNQIVFDDFGSTDWLAQAWIWWYILPGAEGDTLVALESDQRYNTRYDLSPEPSGNEFDLVGIATHEIGHTLGLQHAFGGCLTMYPYVDEGVTQERTLGDGDVIGIRGLYGPLGAPN
jgi:hypothetical protein